MKSRFYITLAAIFCAALSAHAATLDEIITQFPAKDAASSSALFDQLLATDGAIETLATRLVPLGAGDDNPARYAITGLARYVSRPGAEASRAKVEEDILEALEASTNPECKAFLLRQLQQCGGNETVSEIGGLLTDESFASYAALTLDSIGTAKATKVLTKGLRKTSGTTQLQILSVLANNGANRTASNVVRKRLAAAPEMDEYVNLLSILAKLEGTKAQDAFIAAMDRPEPRCRKAALGLAVESLDAAASRKWQKKMDAPGTSAEVKAEIAALLAEGSK